MLENKRNNLIKRGRRNRTSSIIRDLVAESGVTPNDLIMPYFVSSAKKASPIPSMPGIDIHSIDTLLRAVETQLESKVKSLLLFGSTENKNEKSPTGELAFDPNGAVQRAILSLKERFGNDLCVISDVCICSYTSHGHCGIVDNQIILNDHTLPLLAKVAETHVVAGADIIAPSDMMDGRIAYIRNHLDELNYNYIPIMSYASKFASSYYGPFRDAADSAPQFGDRTSYQMDIRNQKESINEAIQDVDEGADIIIIKPALAFLDIIQSTRNATNTPIAAYNVSGEYSMVKAAAKNGWIDEKNIVFENLIAMKRAGANMIISYHSVEAAQKNWLKN
jgi:porphobilinogen synthase